ncbi:type IX secretion system ring subunit PorN/GldN [Neptunitalea lumnitzerae]|uniref:Gliding motility protein GldO n=1 Tax=Neptunitalea lumnitzerae TaxID=2965509 RepID=A0ABQ5MFN8_9FLAO|nr:gliding motility protein GldN [Neptunitalea sp. Y10]GLB47727.1 gliding motility protein GldO [Neptunitalea sp. Y10]
MMNWKKTVLAVLAFVAFGAQYATAQINILNAEKPEDLGKLSAEDSISSNKPIPYGYVSARDVLWQKRVWEFIDLDERVNFPLYYPTDTMRIGTNRRALFSVLVNGFKEGKLDVYDDSYFTTKLEDYNEVEYRLKKKDTLDVAFDFMNANPGEPLPEGYVVETNVKPSDIQGYKIMGVWYFDKKQGELKYRLKGICPVSRDVNFLDAEDGTFVELFWVWYPTARQIMYDSKAFNERNSATPISFDHLLNSRRFNATIYKVENVYGDREIEEYIQDNALFQLLESDRIKEQIRDMEQDMWTY